MVHTKLLWIEYDKEGNAIQATVFFHEIEHEVVVIPKEDMGLSLQGLQQKIYESLHGIKTKNNQGLVAKKT